MFCSSFSGCINPSDQCTSITGKMSATYSGTNEFGISNYIVNLLSEGMETGAFVSEGSPALMLEFVTMNDMSAGENSGMVVPLQTDRGTIWAQVMQDEDNPISKYGKLFVGLLVVLSVGFIISSVFKRRRKKKRNEAQEDSEITDDNVLANQTVREEQISDDSQPKEADVSEKEDENEVAEEKSVASGWAKFGNFFGGKEETQSVDVPEDKKERPCSPVLDQVALDVPKSDSDEVEISLSNEPKKRGWY